MRVMAAIAAGYRKVLISARWAIFLLSCTNECRKRSFHLVETPFSGILHSFQYRGAFSDWKIVTVDHLLMSGCGQSQELAKNV